MFTSAAFFFSDSDSSEEQDIPIPLRVIRDKSNPFELPDARFTQLFRLNKEAFRQVLGEIKNDFRRRARSTSIPPLLRLCAALRFFAEGKFQQGVGQDFNIGMSQPTISNVLSESLDILEQVICPQWIQFPHSDDERLYTKKTFLNATGFPGVIGTVDGMHVNIIRPKENDHKFYNKRKGYSINAMVVCDHELRIRCIDARFGGKASNALVWNASDLKKYLEDNWNNGGNNESWILGGYDYPLQPYLITPFTEDFTGYEAHFNKKLFETREAVKKTISLLKSRFRCLRSKELYYSPRKASQIINVCCALHNICLFYKIDFDENLIFEETDDFDEGFDCYRNISEDKEAQDIRNRIMKFL